MKSSKAEIGEVIGGFAVLSTVFCLVVWGGVELYEWWTAEPPTAEDVTVELTAKELVSAYEDNEVNADARYKDKIARIRGKVKLIDKGPLGGLSVTLRGNLIMAGSVICSFDSSWADSLASLRKGDEVSVIGVIEGRWLNSEVDVSVDDCRLE